MVGAVVNSPSPKRGLDLVAAPLYKSSSDIIWLIPVGHNVFISIILGIILLIPRCLLPEPIEVDRGV